MASAPTSIARRRALHRLAGRACARSSARRPPRPRRDTFARAPSARSGRGLCSAIPRDVTGSPRRSCSVSGATTCTTCSSASSDPRVSSRTVPRRWRLVSPRSSPTTSTIRFLLGSVAAVAMMPSVGPRPRIAHARLGYLWSARSILSTASSGCSLSSSTTRWRYARPRSIAMTSLGTVNARRSDRRAGPRSPAASLLLAVPTPRHDSKMAVVVRWEAPRPGTDDRVSGGDGPAPGVQDVPAEDADAKLRCQLEVHHRGGLEAPDAAACEQTAVAHCARASQSMHFESPGIAHCVRRGAAARCSRRF